MIWGKCSKLGLMFLVFVACGGFGFVTTNLPDIRTYFQRAVDLTLLGKCLATHSYCSRSKAGSNIKCPGDLCFVKHLFWPFLKLSI